MLICKHFHPESDVTKSLVSLFASMSPSNDDVRAAILKALVTLMEVGVVSRDELLVTEFLDNLSKSFSRDLVDTAACKVAVELLRRLVDDIVDLASIRKVREIVGFNLGVVSSISNDVDICEKVDRIKNRFDAVGSRGQT